MGIIGSSKLSKKSWITGALITAAAILGAIMFGRRGDECDECSCDKESAPDEETIIDVPIDDAGQGE